MELIQERMLQILGVRPNEFELEISQPTGRSLYFKRFVLDLVRTNDFKEIEEGAIESDMAKLPLDIDKPENDITARDVAAQSWEQLDDAVTIASLGEN